MQLPETHDTVPAIAKLSAAQHREPAAASDRNITPWPLAHYRPGSPLHWDYPAADSEDQ